MKGAAHLLRRYGIALHPYDCTMLMSYVLDDGQIRAHDRELTGALEHELGSRKGLIGTGKSLCHSPTSRRRWRAISPPSGPMPRCACICS
jgi:hypothetical protein